MLPLALAVQNHVKDVPDGSQLISVRHQPLGPVSYLVEPDDEMSIEGVDLVSGGVVTLWHHMRYGRVYSVCSGPSVTEIALHSDEDQAAEFRQRSAQLQQDHLDVLKDLGVDPESIAYQDASDGDTGGDDE